ncbi:MAG: LacI family DNA-binding transcriptional regulator [Capsulimonadaceae bacterium]|nr:LacI family DNA-binding transcriptional regulator [Capsulimonadaceae bacterium]
MATTQSDIARRANVSRSLVAQVLTGSPRTRTTDETRHRILQAAKELGYRPNAAARSLRKGRTNMIGVVTPLHPHLFTMPYFVQVIGGVLDASMQTGQTMALFDGNVWAPDDPDRLIFLDGRCDGLIVIAALEIQGLTQGLQCANIPFVAVNSGETPADMSSIDIDNFQTGQIATQHLLELGHRRIAFFYDGQERLFTHQRLEGYKAALAVGGVPFDERLVFGRRPLCSPFENAKRAAALLPEVTALFGATDRVALEAIQGLREAGVQVPTQISVVGVNGEFDGEVSVPALTTVSQRLEALGVEAARMLFDMIAAPNVAPRKVNWPVELILRKSTAYLTDGKRAGLREFVD